MLKAENKICNYFSFFKWSLFYFFIAISFSYPIYSEKVITQKIDQPDDFYGLKIGGVVSPSFGYRTRDKSSGLTDTRSNDQTGFSLPWTLLTINKEWEDKGWELELWLELLRANAFTIDTKSSGGTKADPYTVGIRRGNIQKKIATGNFHHKFIFGMQENPNTFTQWNGSWDWRYIDRSPMESLGFFAAPADLGFSWLVESSIFQLHLGLANGEGYRSVQNQESSGIDAYGRFSIMPNFDEWKLGLHFIGRSKNLVGLAGNECIEGRSNCLLSDNDILTRKEIDLRSRKGETLGAELTLDHIKYLHLGLGGMIRRDYGGEIRDRLRQDLPVEYGRDQFGKAAYTWLGVGWEDVWAVFRAETGTGSSGVMNANFQSKDEPFQRLGLTEPIPSDIDPATILYSSKAYFIRKSILLEYRIDSNMRLGLSYSHLVNHNEKGERERTFIDPIGDERTQREYESQFITQVNRGILSYARKEDRVFLRASFIF
jgi:hypothetical protein